MSGPVPGCSGCYTSLTGWWCDNCEQWPCICTPDEEQQTEAEPESPSTLQQLATQQLEKHGRDRYPTVHEQLLKLVSEVGELADAWLKYGSANDAFKGELADVALSLATLANKIGLDLVALTRHLVETDSRTFD